MPTRRAFLLGGGSVATLAVAGAAVGVEEGALPGRLWIRERLGLDGPAGVVPEVAPGRLTRGSFVSAHRPGTRTRWAITRPPGAPARLPVVVALHGLHEDAGSVIGGSLAVDRFLAATVASGTPPFAVAAVDGGTSYWHPHDGTDTGAMVVDELLPLLARQGLDTRRIGFLGWSMGGYGALRLAGLLGHDRVAGVVASSPALWTDPGDASRSGFDDAEEYRRYSVMDRQHDLDGIAVRVDVGTGDPFYPAVKDYVDGFPADAHVVSTFQRGAHKPAYWHRMLPAQLAFLGRALAPGVRSGS